MKKLICNILSVVLLISLVSCSGSAAGKPSVTTDGSTTAQGADTFASDIYYEPDSLPDALDFGGKEVVILSLNGLDTSYETNFTVEELSGNFILDSVYNRELYVEDRLGVEINNVKVDGVTNEIDKEIAAGDSNYDIFVHANHILSRYVFDGYLTDLYAVEHLDLDKPWWSDGFNSEAEIMDALYFTTGSICLSLIRNSYAVYYNKTIVENYKSEYPELGNLYDIVDEGKWTLDKFVELGGEIYEDSNGNSKRDSEDIFGIAYNDHTAIDAMWSGFDINIFSRTDDGWFEHDVNTDKLYSSLEKIYSMLYENVGSICNGVLNEQGIACGATDINNCFANGTALFLVAFVSNAETPAFRNMQDDYGILPYPKYDQNQKNYYSYSHDTYGAVSIPASNSNPGIAGAVLEAFASYSYRQTMPIYLDTVLKGQYMSDPQSREMIDLVVSGIKIDAAWIYLGSLGGDYPSSFRYMFREGDRSYAAKHESLKRVCNLKLKVYKLQLEK